MVKLARYYLGRVLRRGELASEKMALAMREPVALEYRGMKYSFVAFSGRSRRNVREPCLDPQEWLFIELV